MVDLINKMCSKLIYKGELKILSLQGENVC